jgi:hypothetical protein
VKREDRGSTSGYYDDEEEAARAYGVRAPKLGRPTNFDLNGVRTRH